MSLKKIKMTKYKYNQIPKLHNQHDNTLPQKTLFKYREMK
jgi:hypothetical protein